MPKITTALLSAKMGVFRTKFVTENVEQRGETWRNVEKGREREGEAQNTTLHAKFSIRYLRLADSQCLKRRS